MDIEQCVRLSPEQFKAVIIGKGWTFKELAARWGISPVWMSNVARNPLRASHYDDAVMGLPARQYLSRSAKRRQDMVNTFLSATDVRGRRNAHREHLSVGAILTAAEDFGSLADMGMRAIVFAVRSKGAAKEYGVIFENGNYDWLPRDLIEQQLVYTGLADEGLPSLDLGTDEHLIEHFKSRNFNFHP